MAEHWLCGTNKKLNLLGTNTDKWTSTGYVERIQNRSYWEQTHTNDGTLVMWVDSKTQLIGNNLAQMGEYR